MCLICERIEAIQQNENPYFVKELTTGYVVIGDHQHFKGYTLFLLKQHVTELDQLSRDTRNLHLAEMADVSEAVKRAFGADKMNCELLGNGDAHVHWHLFPRRQGDLGAYGHHGRGPVWWYPMDQMFHQNNLVQPDELENLKIKLKKTLDEMVI